LAGLLSVFV
jgi:hypothetical protein